MSSHDNDDDDNDNDLTRIEDLSEFLHQEDPELDALLGDSPPPFDDQDDESEIMTGLDDLEDSDSFQEQPEEQEEETTFSEEDEVPSFDESTEEEVSFESSEPFESADEDTFSETEEDQEFTNSDEDFSLSETVEESPSFEEEAPSFDEPEEQSFEEEAPAFSQDDEQEVEEEAYVPQAVPYQAEKLQDVKSFAENMSYGKVTMGGNPPYAIIVKNIKYIEDADDILAILREAGLVDGANEETMKIGLNQGAILLSQLSEYAAIYLAHKMRRFDVEILMGPSDELHPPKSYDRDSRGLVSKEHLFQNKKEEFYQGDGPVSLDSVIVATTPTIQTHKIHKYLGVVNCEKTLTSDEIKKESRKQSLEKRGERQEYSPRVQGTFHTEEELIDRYESGAIGPYDLLMNEIKTKAFKLGGNGALGLVYNLTPLGKNPDDPYDNQTYYKLMATANVVILSKDS